MVKDNSERKPADSLGYSLNTSTVGREIENTAREPVGRKEGKVLSNDALNTFYLRLYGRNEGNVFI